MDELPIVTPVIVIALLFMLGGIAFGLASMKNGELRRAEEIKHDLPEDYPALDESAAPPDVAPKA